MATAWVGREDYAAFSRHTTRWNDNDIYGHLNNAIHYTIFDSAVNEWLIARGLLEPGRSAVFGVVAETGCRYLAEMKYPSVITAGLRVARIGRSSVRYDLALFADDDTNASATGFFVHVYVDAATRRSCPVPEATRVALESLMLPGLEGKGADGT